MYPILGISKALNLSAPTPSMESRRSEKAGRPARALGELQVRGCAIFLLWQDFSHR